MKDPNYLEERLKVRNAGKNQKREPVIHEYSQVLSCSIKYLDYGIGHLKN